MFLSLIKPTHSTNYKGGGGLWGDNLGEIFPWRNLGLLAVLAMSELREGCSLLPYCLLFPHLPCIMYPCTIPPLPSLPENFS